MAGRWWAIGVALWGLAACEPFRGEAGSPPASGDAGAAIADAGADSGPPKVEGKPVPADDCLGAQIDYDWDERIPDQSIFIGTPELRTGDPVHRGYARMRQHDFQSGAYMDLLQTIPAHTRICIRADVRISATTAATLSPRSILRLSGGSAAGISLDVNGYFFLSRADGSFTQPAPDLPGKWHSYSLLFVRDAAAGAYTVVFGVDGAVVHTAKQPPGDLVTTYRAGAPGLLWKEAIDVDVDNLRVRVDP
jgi:hypothetical protein